MAEKEKLPEGIELIDARHGNLFLLCRKEKFERIRDFVFFVISFLQKPKSRILIRKQSGT